MRSHEKRISGNLYRYRESAVFRSMGCRLGSNVRKREMLISFQAPELFLESGASSFETDVYALGMVSESHVFNCRGCGRTK
jgi:hypothetical protein